MYRDVVPVLASCALSIIASPFKDVKDEKETAAGSISQTMSREPSQQCLLLLKQLRIFNDTVAIPAEKVLIDHYMHADGKWPERYNKLSFFSFQQIDWSLLRCRQITFVFSFLV